MPELPDLALYVEALTRQAVGRRMRKEMEKRRRVQGDP